jgi:hypothetical protein
MDDPDETAKSAPRGETAKSPDDETAKSRQSRNPQGRPAVECTVADVVKVVRATYGDGPLTTMAFTVNPEADLCASAKLRQCVLDLLKLDSNVSKGQVSWFFLKSRFSKARFLSCSF